MSMIKDKAYSIRLNKQLVDKIKTETGLSPQKILDAALTKYHKLWVESEDPVRVGRGRPFGSKTKVPFDTDVEDL